MKTKVIAGFSRLANSAVVLSLILGPVNGRTSSLATQAWGLNGSFGLGVSGARNLMLTSCENSEVVIAVIDTGIDMAHPALAKSLWVNNAEKNGKPGVDDDRNGFVDDVHGWDFVKKSGALTDGHGHGTHISGIISAQGSSPEEDFSGTCPGAKIMSLRYYDPNARGDENLINTVRAIDYAVKMNVDIINYSGGGNSFSSKEFEALKGAQGAGVLVVAAAGNETNQTDEKPYYPANYDLKNIISVAAINESGFKLSRSNYGVRTVHLAAPGQSILSTLPGGSYGFLSGTSQATAFVTGIAAIILTEAKNYLAPKTKVEKVRLVREWIQEGTESVATLKNMVSTGGRASALKTIQLVQTRIGTAPKKDANTKNIQASNPVKEVRKDPRPASLADSNELVTFSVRSLDTKKKNKRKRNL